MEDFGNILWIVLIGASLIYSAADKKARKKRSSRSAGPQERHGEAWPVFGPLIDPASDSEWQPMAPASDSEWQRMVPASDSEWQRMAPASDSEWQRMAPDSEWRRSNPIPDSEWQPIGPSPQPGKAQKHPRESFETRMDGSNGLPTRRSRKEASAAAFAADESLQIAQRQTDVSAKNRSETNRPNAQASERTAPEPSGPKIVPEEFDLKRAVIYSELLKPKFDD